MENTFDAKKVTETMDNSQQKLKNWKKKARMKKLTFKKIQK